MHNARIGHFRPMADFDWKWPKKVDRDQIEEAVRLDFLGRGRQRDPRRQERRRQDDDRPEHRPPGGACRQERPHHDGERTPLRPRVAGEHGRAHAPDQAVREPAALLVIDEVGYLSSTAKHADLLFEVVTRRYQERRPIVLTTNKPFKEWGDVFPSAGCVVTLVDRLIHRSEIIHIDGDSYRKHESDKRQQQRGKKKPPPPEPTGALVPRT